MNQTQSPQAGTPGQGTSNQGRPSINVPPYQPPTTPEQVAKEQERINLLLEINNEILQHVSSLQTEGQGGVMPGQQVAGAQKPPSQEYIRCALVTGLGQVHLEYADTYIVAACGLFNTTSPG